MDVLCALKAKDQAIVCAWDEALDIALEALGITDALLHPATAQMLWVRNMLAGSFGIDRRDRL